MELVIIGHLLGDFYFQTGKIAEKKKISIGCMLKHCTIYAVMISVAVVLQTGIVLNCLCPIAIMSISHIIVDIIKITIEKKWIKTERAKCWIFLGDQFVHIVILIFICMYYHINLSSVSIIPQNDVVCVQNMAVVIGGLICGKPAAIIVSKVLAMISEHGADANAQNGNGQVDNEIVGAGSWIGILEREVILLLGLLGQYGAIGFVLTAKSVARYQQLEDKTFAEKYLIGTLLSAFIAIVCVSACSHMLQ